MATAVEVFAARVQKERLLRDWTLRRLRDLSEVPLARLHRIETGKLTPSLEDVVRLADAFGVPMSWLTYGSEVRARVVAAARCEHETAAEASLDAVMPVLELAEQLDASVDDDAVPQVSGLPACPRGRTAPRVWGRAVAEQLRRDWGVPSGPLLALPQLVEDKTNVLVVVAPLDAGADGLALTDPQSGHTMIAVRQTELWERQRFTIAHELGHLIAGDRLIEAVPSGSGRSAPAETAASEFARHLLVPVSDLRLLDRERAEGWDAAGVAETAWRYQVSPVVVAIQLIRAGLAHDSLAEKARAVNASTWSRLGGWEPQHRALAAEANTHRVPPALVQRALAAHRAGALPAATIARVLGEAPEVVADGLAELGEKPLAAV